MARPGFSEHLAESAAGREFFEMPGPSRGDLLRSDGGVVRLPRPVVAKWWRVPVGEVPRSADHESQVKWLYDWWQRIDAWIAANRPEDATAPALSTGPAAD